MIKYYLLCFIFSILLISCKNDLEKIDINDIEANRSFQDSILNKPYKEHNAEEFIKKNDSIISLYKNLNLENKEINSNYLYYLGRLYFKINDLPFSYFYDETHKSFKNENKYREYYDSGFNYTLKALSYDPENFRAMYNLVFSSFNEISKFYLSNDKTFSQEKNSERFNYILNNISKFMKLKNSKYDNLIDEMSEYAFSLFEFNYFKSNYTFKENDANRSKILNVFGDVIDRVKNLKSLKHINKKHFNQNISEIERNVELARKEEKRNEMLAKVSFKHKYYYFDSNTGYSSLIELYTDSDFTIVSTGGFNYHGTYSINGNYIYFNYANKTMVINGVNVEADESVAPSKIRFEILDNGIINLIQNDGSVYRQKDK